MAFGATPKDSGSIPIGEVYIPNTGFAALQGSAISTTDGSSNLSAPVAFQRAAGTVLLIASAANTTNFTGSSLTVGPYTELAVDVNITAVSGTSPQLQLFVDRQGADGIWYTIWSSSTISTVQAVSTSIGSGLTTNVSFGTTARIRWTISGTSPSFTMSVSLVGK